MNVCMSIDGKEQISHFVIESFNRYVPGANYEPSTFLSAGMY